MAIDLSLIKFFVEGDGDKVFLRDILKSWYGHQLNKDKLGELIIICRGYSQISKQIDEFKQIDPNQKREGGVNIVIFDADYSGREVEHGYKEKMKYLDDKKNELGITFETFLFPDNRSDGTLETLLEHCVCEEHKEIISCWDGLERCIQSKGEKYTIPAPKSKIYVYLECLYGSSNSEKEKIKDPNRDFTLEDKWNIDYNNNEYLGSLKSFLDEYLA